MKGKNVYGIGGIGAVLLAVLCLTVTLLLLPAHVATIRLPRSENSLVGAVRTALGGDIRLSYLHSVERTPVEGRFTVGPGASLRIKETRMMSVGTGLPNTFPERTRRDGAWMVVDESMQTLPELDFRLSPVNRIRITVDGSEVSLETVPSGSVIRLGVEKINWGRYLLWHLTAADWRKES